MDSKQLAAALREIVSLPYGPKRQKKLAALAGDETALCLIQQSFEATEGALRYQ